MQEQVRRSNKERSEVMRDALIGAARALFVEKGFAGTGTPEIVAAAGVTRGALYHHFADKEALFDAVIRAEAEAVAADIEAEDFKGLSPAKAVIRGGEAFLQAMLAPGRTRLMLIEAPAVIGSVRLAEIDRDTGGRTLVAGLAAAGIDSPELAQLMSAGYDRVALAMEQGEAPGPWLLALNRMVRGVMGAEA
jgi:AcrR family transcriptional regulator